MKTTWFTVYNETPNKPLKSWIKATRSEAYALSERLAGRVVVVRIVEFPAGTYDAIVEVNK